MFRKIKNKFQILKLIFTENLKHIFGKNVIYLGGWSHSTNFGDGLNYFLVQYLSEKIVIHSRFIKFFHEEIIYNVVGSILQWAKKNSIIWGAGFISSDSQLITKDLTIFAVRGKLSVEILNRNNINTANIAIGDPALLLPYIYDPKIEKKYKVGILPHYVDKNHPWVLKNSSTDTIVIDIECGPNWKNFIDQILSCEIIVSSSLHGLIVADAYGLPTTWVSFSNQIQGKGFKFQDYYSSIGEIDQDCLEISDETSLDQLISFSTKKNNGINLEKLVVNCPFITQQKKSFLLKKINEKRNSFQ